MYCFILRHSQQALKRSIHFVTITEMRLSRDNSDIVAMDHYCIALLRRMQREICAMCPRNLRLYGFQLDHKRYGPDITLYDLQLLCGNCHARKSGCKSLQGTLREFPLMEVL